MSQPRIAIIGTGIVGLAVAYYLAKSGSQVTLIDREPRGDKASLGNAGGIAVTEVIPASVPWVWSRIFGWMLDPLGPLAVRPAYALKLLPWIARFAQSGRPRELDRISRALAALNGRVYEDLLPMLEDIGLICHLHRNGALAVYQSERGFQRDASEWQIKRSLGVVAEVLSGTDARKMEPALSGEICRAVWMPQWSYVSDPALLVRGLVEWLLSRGVVIKRGEVRHVLAAATTVCVKLEGGSSIAADRAVIAAGAWSAALTAPLGDRILLESERGYNATLPNPGITLGRQLIFAERKFVATPLTCGMRIGGAAEFGGLTAVANFARSRVLVELARRYLPGLETGGAVNWAGHRPATPDSLPVIGPATRVPNVFYAFGHGHLGLTQAATTGRLIRDLILHRPPPIDMTAYGVRRLD